MKKARMLALRVALNSAVMIFIVYLVMQTVVFFRDCLFFGTGTFEDFSSTVIAFVGGRVLPPLVVFGALLWVAALPIQKVAVALEAGVEPTPEVAEKTRRQILQFRTIVLAVNLIGFTVGFLLDLLLSGRLAELVQVHRLTVLGGNLCGAFVFAAAQTSLNNVAFAPLRDRLNVTSLAGRRREASTTNRQIRLTAALVLYALFVLQYNQHDVTVFQSWGTTVLAQVQAGTVPADQALDVYRQLVATNLHQVSTRDPATTASLAAPWTTSAAGLQEGGFLLLGTLMLIFGLGVQWAVSREQKAGIEALQNRIRDVVAGGGDLRKRLSLRAMDDQGELADLVNRLLDQFQTIVGRIAAAAAQSREGSGAVDAVLVQAEALSGQVGASVATLKAELDEQVAQARALNGALDSFRQAAAAVDAEAADQGRFVAETSAAMDEMSASIEGVRRQSQQAGQLTETLARQGEGGGEAVLQTTQAIVGIQKSSTEVLLVLGALKKIASDTNLLAMNAAIEAAHAGDRGAGFAVVADEVRKLANTAQSQTRAIKDLIQTMAKQVEAGVERAQASGQVLADLAKGLHDSAAASGAVADAMDEQAGRTQTVGQSLTQVVRTSDSIRQKMAVQGRSTDQMTAALDQTLLKLAQLAETSQAQAQAVASLEASFTQVRREVDRSAAASRTLQAEIDRFQV